MNQTKNEDIDFIEFFILLWQGKWIILSSIIVFGLVGGFYLFNKSVQNKNELPEYRSEITYSVNTSHAIFFETLKHSDIEKKIISNFRELFYQEDIFSEWKSLNGQSEIMFEEFSIIKDFNGIFVKKNEDDRLTTFKFKEDGNYILVNTNKLSKINELYDYSNYVSDFLTSKYESLAIKRYEKISNILNGLSGYSNDYNFNISTFINEQIAIDTYLDDVENGDRAIDIQNPTQPENLNFSQYENISILKIAVFLILGSIIGVFITFIRSAIIKRKDITF